MNNLTDIEIGWLAGILDGEDTFTAHEERAHTKIGTVYINKRARVRCQMTDEDVLNKLFTTTGVGTVAGPYEQRGLGTQPTWTWQVSKLQDVRDIIDTIYPHMSFRRQIRINEMRLLKGWT